MIWSDFLNLGRKILQDDADLFLEIEAVVEYSNLLQSHSTSLQETGLPGDSDSKAFHEFIVNDRKGIDAVFYNFRRYHKLY